MGRHSTTRITAIVFAGLAWLLSGCLAADATPALPTATALPTQAVPTATATFLPPPTVTSYPSPTMRGAEGIVIAPPADVPTDAAGAPAAPAAPDVQDTAVPVATATPVPTEAPTLTPTLAFINLPSGISLANSLYSTNFDGWPAFNDPTAKSSFSGGVYHFDMGPFDGRFLNTTALNADNIYIQLDVTPGTCPEKAGYGVMFHFKDASNYYLLTVFCDNTYTAVAKVAGSVQALNYGNLPSGLDAKSSETHHLGVLANGNQFTMYLEGQPIGSFTDNQFPRGDVAIYASSQGGKVLKIDFEGLKIWSVQ